MNKFFSLLMIFLATFAIAKEKPFSISMPKFLETKTYTGVDLLIQNDWINDPHVVSSGKDFLPYPIKNDPETIVKLFNEKCEHSNDVFCALASEISKDSPPEYDEWLTVKENLRARETYYAKKTIPFITLKIPLELTICREEKNILNNMDFVQKQLKNGKWAISDAVCYSIERESFAFGPDNVKSFNRSRDITAKAKWGKDHNIHFFDISNPHGLYCENRSCTKMDYAIRQCDCPLASFDPNVNGTDFASFFTVTQTVRNTAERKISDKLLKEMYKTLPEGGEINPEKLKRKYTWEIYNRLVVIGKSRFTIKPNVVDGGVQFIQRWAAPTPGAPRSWVKENFDRFDAYAVVTIPLIESSKRIRTNALGTEQSFYGFFKGYELMLDGESVWCSYKKEEYRINC